MTPHDPRLCTFDDQTTRPDSDPCPQIEAHTSTTPKSFDEGSVFTRAALQTTQLLELPAELRNRLMGDHGAKQPLAAPPAEVNPYQGNTQLLDARALNRALERERSIHAADVARPASAELDPTATLYDGGALREHALKLAQELGSAAAGQRPLDPGAGESPPALGRAARVQAKALSAIGSAWREASLARRATAILLPLAALGTLWPDEPAEARSATPAAPTAPVSRAPAPEPAKHAPPVPAPAPAPTSPGEPPNVPGAANEPTPSQRFVEAQALKAAFSGDTQAAARHYERLARERRDPRFELALRLVRAEAMRRP